MVKAISVLASIIKGEGATCVVREPQKFLEQGSNIICSTFFWVGDGADKYG